MFQGEIGISFYKNYVLKALAINILRNISIKGSNYKMRQAKIVLKLALTH